MNYNYKPMLDPLAMLGAFQDFQIRQAQTNNLRTQNEIMNQEAGIKKLERQYLEETLPFRKTDSDMRARLRAIEYGYKGNDWSFTGGEPTPFQHYQLESLKAGIANREASTGMFGATQYLREREGAMYDLNAWARILSAFGLKLPSLNFGRASRGITGSTAKPIPKGKSGATRTTKNGNVTVKQWYQN